VRLAEPAQRGLVIDWRTSVVWSQIMLLTFVGLTFDLRCDDDTRRRLEHEWPEFLARELSTSPNVIVDARRVEALDEPVESTDVVVARTGSSWCFQRRDFTLHWSPSSREGTLSYTRPFSLTAALRVLLAMALRSEGGVLFHASSVRVADEALVFPGVSGYGKTTVATLAAPRGVLSDEITGVRIEGDRIMVHPTPFWGDMPRTRAADAAPLQAIVLLERGAPPSLGPAVSGVALATLLEAALLFDTEVAGREDKSALVDLLGHIVARAPCRRLRYALPANPWELLDGGDARTNGRTDEERSMSATN